MTLMSLGGRITHLNAVTAAIGRDPRNSGG